MITAQQVAQGMALQQQQHSMLTAGASGMMQAQPAMGMSQYPPQFSYAMPSNPNHGRAALGSSMVMGGMTGGINAASSIANLAAIPATAAGIGSLGFAGANFLGLGGGATAASLGAMSGGFMTGAALPMAGLGVAAGTASAMRSGMQQTQQVNQLFGGMQFANMGGDPRTGRGFSQNDLGQIQRGIRAINANNPFVSMSDALRSSEQFTDMGMHQGVQDAEKMARKLTEMGKTMHQMARIMGTSMEEAGKAMGSMRSSGFYSASDVMGNTADMNLMRGYGMTSDRFAGMQASGAAATRGAQLSGRAGAGFVTGAAQDIMSGIRTGALSGEQIMDITGGRDPLEAAQMMAQQSLGATMQGLSGPGGTAMLAAMGTMKDGKFTGGIDAGVMRQMAEGKLGLRDLSARGQKKVGSSRSSQVSFVANQKDIMDTALQSPEMSEALLNVIRTEAREMGDESEEYLQVLAQTQFNMDRRQFRILSRMAEDRKKGHRERLSSLKREVDTSSRSAYLRENRTLGGFVQKATGGAADLWQQGAVDFFSDASRDITEGFQEAERRIYGDTEVSVSRSAIQDVIMAGKGNSSALSKVSPTVAARHAMSTGNMDAFTGTLGVSDELLGSVDLEGVNQGARAAMSAERGGVAARKLGLPSGRSAKLEALRAEVRDQVRGKGSVATPAEIDAIIAKSGAAGARLIAQDKSQTRVWEDGWNKVPSFGARGGAADSVIASQKSLAAESGLDDLSNEAAGAAVAFLGSRMVATGAVLAVVGGPMGWAAGATTIAAGVAVGGVGILMGLGDSDLDDMQEDFTSGKAGTELVADYADKDKQVKIDEIIADAAASSDTLAEGREKAAKNLSKLLGRPVSARDVEIADTVMQKRTNKNAAERKTLTSAEREKMVKVAKMGKAQVGLVATKRVAESLKGLGNEIGMADVDETTRAAFRKATSGLAGGDGDAFENLGSALRAAAGGGFEVGENASGTRQIFGLGVDAYNELQGMGEDGLTLEEMATVTNYKKEDLEKILKRVGVSATGGVVKGRRDIEKVTGALSSQMVAGVLTEGKEGIQRVLDSGKTQEQITAEAVTAMTTAVNQSVEMTEALYKTVRNEGLDVQLVDPDSAAKGEK